MNIFNLSRKMIALCFIIAVLEFLVGMFTPNKYVFLWLTNYLLSGLFFAFIMGD